MSTVERDLPPRTLVLCFDGTGSRFSSTNTNVVKLFSLLKKDNKDEQLVYYQAGMGTYLAPGMMSRVELWAAKLLDQAFAWYLDAHVMGGYQFLMQNYRTGDRVCLFGFSRGAYTARALAGMLYKVGLLPRDNIEQISFAYQMYKDTGATNNSLANSFKRTFSRCVKIEFMGCWETVSSLGVLLSRHLPFTSSNTSIKCFRHALSLDEHRAKFQPNTWHKDAPNDSCANYDPEQGSHVPRDKNSDVEKGRMADDIGPPTDVLEVWFAGSHSDVGGGENPSDMQCTLSNIPLRWMIREIVQAKCGVQFDNQAFADLGIPLSILGGSDVGDVAKDDALDAVEPLHDELKTTPIWWIVEVIPLFVSWQDEKGIWHRSFRWNLGRGRTVEATEPKLHSTVRQRMQSKSLAYVPKAKWNQANTIWVD